MKQVTKREKRKLWFQKLSYRVICALGFNHQKYLRKHKVFGLFGDSVLYQTHYLPNNPKRVKIHDNVKIAANVIFYEHDVINGLFEKYDPSVKLHGHGSCIEIYENSFIGGSAIIIGDVSIGPNAIVGGGAVVTKDVQPGTIVAGNPAKVIGRFENLLKKRQMMDKDDETMGANDFLEKDWEKFYKIRAK